MAYTYTPGADPIYDAYLSGLEANQAAARRNYEYANSTTDANVSTALGDLSRTADMGRKSLRTGAISRGIYRSSVAGNQAGEYEGDVARRGESIRTQGEQVKQRANMTYADQQAQYLADRQIQEATSATRLRDEADRRNELERQRIAAEENAKRIAEDQKIARLEPGTDFGSLARLQDPNAAAVDKAKADIAAGKDLGWNFGGESEADKARKAIASGVDLGWRF